MQRTMIWSLMLVLCLTVFSAPVRAVGAEVRDTDFSFSAGESKVPSLLDSPEPFFHDYNLSVLFPVNRGIAGAGFGQIEAGGGRTLSLRQCIERALEDSPNHKKARENLRAAAGELLSAWGNYTPNLSARFGINQNNRNSSFVDPSGVIRTSGGISKSSFGSLNFSFPIFNRAQKYFQMRNARFFRQERELRIHSSELTLVNQVRQAYFNVLRDRKLLLAAQRQADQRKEQLRLAEARFSVGSVTRLDVLQAQIEVRNSELQILQAENALATARMDLNRVMGGKLGEQYELADDYGVSMVELDSEALVSFAVENHPSVKTLEMQIRQQEGMLWMGRLAYLPTISAGASYQRSEDGLLLLPRQVQSRGLNLAIAWDVLDSFGRFRANRNTEIALHNLNYDLATSRLDVEREVRAGLLELDRLYQRHVTLRESEQLAAQSLELEQERYRLGASSLLELRQAQVDYSQAEVNFINSIYDFHIELSRLSQNVGRDLTGQYDNN